MLCKSRLLGPLPRILLGHCLTSSLTTTTSCFTIQALHNSVFLNRHCLVFLQRGELLSFSFIPMLFHFVSLFQVQICFDLFRFFFMLVLSIPWLCSVFKAFFFPFHLMFSCRKFKMSESGTGSMKKRRKEEKVRNYK